VVAVNDFEDLWTALEPRLQHNAVILLKGSRGMKLERIVPQLTAWATKAPPTPR
jgi:UDP-N-acetylmuramoyl-tripeptide--D-alanyl-D-alanine ligase